MKDHDVTVRHVETRKIGEDGVAGASRNTTLLTGDDVLKVASGSQNVTVARSVSEKYGLSQSTTVGGPISIRSSALINLTCGASSIVMTPFSITIKSPSVQILGDANVTIHGPIKSDTF